MRTENYLLLIEQKSTTLDRKVMEAQCIQRNRTEDLNKMQLRAYLLF